MLNEFEARNRFQLSAGGCCAAADVCWWWWWASNQAGPCTGHRRRRRQRYKNFFLLNHNFADGASRCRPVYTERSLTPHHTKTDPFPPPLITGPLPPFLAARLGHCIIDQMHFLCLDILLMHARSSRTTITTNARQASLVTPILLLHPPPGGSICVSTQFIRELRMPR